jgi:hypothetical protein
VLLTDDDAVNKDDLQQSHKTTAFIKHDWLIRRRDGLYCTVCQKFGIVNQSNQGVWTEKPFTNLKKLYFSTEKHASSSSHTHSVFMSHLYERAQNTGRGHVCDQARAHAAERAISDKEVLKKLFCAAYFVFKEEIAHITNWEPLLQLLGESDFSGRVKSFLKTRPRNATYQSSTSITEILESISAALDDKLTEQLRQSIGKFGTWALTADEETNVKNQQVLSVCARFLSCDESSIVEQLIAVVTIQNTTAETVASAIANCCAKRNLDMTKLSALSFDGASNMAGRHGGVQALLKERHCTRAMFIHCRSHRLQLTLQNAAHECKLVISHKSNSYWRAWEVFINCSLRVQKTGSTL